MDKVVLIQVLSVIILLPFIQLSVLRIRLSRADTVAPFEATVPWDSVSLHAYSLKKKLAWFRWKVVFIRWGGFGVLELIRLLLQIKSHRFFFSVTLNFSFTVSGPGLWVPLPSMAALQWKIEEAKVPMISTEMSDNRTVDCIVCDSSFLSMPQFGPWPTSMKLSVPLQFTRSWTVGRTPWTGDQLVARPLPVHKHRKTHIYKH
jgi:hypothetical protein